MEKKLVAKLMELVELIKEVDPSTDYVSATYLYDEDGSYVRIVADHGEERVINVTDFPKVEDQE